MTTAITSAPSGGGEAQVPPEDLVTLTIDGIQISVPKGTLVIRAAELLGIEVPRFCDHPLLDPAGACRQCIVEVEGQRKPMTSCTLTCTDGMTVKTQLTSPVAEKAQRGVMELLLINHPLDCPICDKGGECPLQNQAMSTGRPDSRFEGTKRTFTKPVPLSPQVLLDRERCVLCARCTRYSQQIAGDPMIEMLDRGALQKVGTGEAPFQSYFSGDTIQICPVGALTSAAYRFRSRPFDLVSSPGACEHCASGCAIRTDHRRGKVMRRLAENDPEVNEEWMCDKGRFAFRYAQRPERLTSPLVRNADSGELEPAGWPEALRAAARGLSAAGSRSAVLAGGRLTVEDAYAYAKFARVVLGTDDIDFRARAHSREEAGFLAGRVAGHGLDLDGTGVTYTALEGASAVLLVSFEPEEESPIVFLRLRKAYRKRGLRTWAIASHATRGLERVGGALLPTVPGTETERLDALAGGVGLDAEGQRAAEALRTGGALIVVGERLAAVPGAFTAAVRAATATGARLVWIPRRAGERGALEAGALPGLLPRGRPADDPRARAQVAAVWGVDVAALPPGTGRDTGGIVAAAADGELDALVVAGVEPADLPDPEQARRALDRAGFVVSLELRPSEVTERADVVLPVAAAAEKSGTFLTWEGRARPFEAALKPDQMTRRQAPPDSRVLDMLAEAMGVAQLGLPDIPAVRQELDRLGAWDGPRASGASGPWSSAAARPWEQAASPPATGSRTAVPRPGAAQAVLASHRMLLDQGLLQAGDDALAATRREAVARLSPATAAEVGAADGTLLTVTGPAGSLRLPLRITPMPDRVVWLPQNSTGAGIHSDLGSVPGSLVTITSDAAAKDVDVTERETPEDAEAAAGARTTADTGSTAAARTTEEEA